MDEVFWYKYIDQTSARGSDRCGFKIIINKEYVINAENFDKTIVEENLKKIIVPNLSSITYMVHWKNEIHPNFFHSLFTKARNSIYLDRDADRFSDFDLEKYLCYYSGNCHNAFVRHGLELAFFAWAEEIELSYLR